MDTTRTTTYSDEYLDFWGEIYLANPAVRLSGIAFDDFLRAPQTHLRAATAPLVDDDDDERPPLAAQQAVADRLAAEDAYRRAS